MSSAFKQLKAIINKVALGAVTATLITGSLALSGCGQKLKPPHVHLSVWCAQEDIPMVEDMVETFKINNAEKANLEITISAESEMTCKTTVLNNPEAAADIYAFAADQFMELNRAGALLEITENTKDIIEENGGLSSGAIKSAMVDGKLYACPITSSNGYFLYYNSDYFTPQDVESLDTMLDIAAKNNKKIAMDLTSGWYLYSFFKGAGLNATVMEDGANYCNWNATDTYYTGVDVAEALLKIAAHPGFISCGDADFVEGAAKGEIIAGVNGTWNSTSVEQAYGKGYAATRLPKYSLKGDMVQMCSFAGYKLMGVNANTQEPQWAMELARWLTNEENQLTRFRLRGEGPSNVKAAQSEEVQASPAIAALQAQSEYGYPETIGEAFWTPTNVFGTVIASQNIDNVDLQFLLDNTQKAIVTPPPEE